jgi:hypothetical protein
MKSRIVIAVLSYLAAALLVLSSLTMGWGGGDAQDGTRYKVSPVGLSHVLTPHQTVSATEDCRWYFGGPDRGPCRVAAGGETAFGRLRMVVPLGGVTVALCLVGIALALTGRRGTTVSLLVAGLAALLPALMLWIFARNAPRALADLAGTDFGLAATLGTMEMMGAIGLVIGGTAFTLSGLSSGVVALEFGLAVGLPLLGLRFQGWPGVAAAFGVALLVLIFAGIVGSKQTIAKTQSAAAPPV